MNHSSHAREMILASALAFFGLGPVGTVANAAASLGIRIDQFDFSTLDLDINDGIEAGFDSSQDNPTLHGILQTEILKWNLLEGSLNHRPTLSCSQVLRRSVQSPVAGAWVERLTALRELIVVSRWLQPARGRVEGHYCANEEAHSGHSGAALDCAASMQVDVFGRC